MYLQYMNCFLKLCIPVNLTQFLLNMFVSGCISTKFRQMFVVVSWNEVKGKLPQRLDTGGH